MLNTTRTVICAQDDRDARQMAHELGLSWKEVHYLASPQSVRGINSFRVVVTDLFARRRDSDQIWTELRQRAATTTGTPDLPYLPPHGRALYEATPPESSA